MKKNLFVSGILGLVAAIVYFASTADYAYPGESAGLIVCWKGLEPALQAPYPFMAVFAKLLGGGNMIAPICGILAVMAVFHLVRAFVSDRTPDDALADLAALVASIVFLFSPAVRSAATHLEPRLFDFTWAILILALAIPFQRGVRGGAGLYAVLSGVAVALGLTDSALFVTFLPLNVALIVQTARKKSSPAFCLVLFLIAGIVAFFAAAWGFSLDLEVFFRRTVAELASYHTMPGWLYVFIFTTLPFVAILSSGDESFAEEPGRAQLLFHGALSFVTILAIATPLSPSSLMEPYGRLPVATSAFAAVVTGYLAAYWWNHSQLRVARIAVGILALAITGAIVLNVFAFNGAAGAFADKVARKIVDDMGDRRTLVTDGTLDSNLRLAAAEMGKKISLVSLARHRDGQFRIDLGAVTNDMAFFASPDLLHSAGVTPVPEFFLFGADERRQPDWSVWEEYGALLKAPSGWGSCQARKASSPVSRLRLSLRRYLGLVANNRGVYLQNRKRDAEAFALYELVLREIDRDNVSAMLNELELAEKGLPAAQAKKVDLERRLKALAGDKRCQPVLWRLGTVHGYVRNADAFIRRGYDWAQSGRPGETIRKIHVSPEDRALALDISRNDGKSAAEHAQAILRTNPQAPLANYVMGSLALSAGKTAEAESYLRKAADAREPVPLALNDLAETLRRGKNYAEAERYARKCVACAPAMYTAWETLGSVLMDAGGNLDEAESAIRKACELSKGRDGRPVDVRMLVSLARVQLKRGDTKRAQVTLRKIQPRLGELSDFERAECARLQKEL